MKPASWLGVFAIIGFGMGLEAHASFITGKKLESVRIGNPAPRMGPRRSLISELAAALNVSRALAARLISHPDDQEEVVGRDGSKRWVGMRERGIDELGREKKADEIPGLLEKLKNLPAGASDDEARLASLFEALARKYNVSHLEPAALPAVKPERRSEPTREVPEPPADPRPEPEKIAERPKAEEAKRPELPPSPSEKSPSYVYEPSREPAPERAAEPASHGAEQVSQGDPVFWHPQAALGILGVAGALGSKWLYDRWKRDRPSEVHTVCDGAVLIPKRRGFLGGVGGRATVVPKQASAEAPTPDPEEEAFQKRVQKAQQAARERAVEPGKEPPRSQPAGTEPAGTEPETFEERVARAQRAVGRTPMTDEEFQARVAKARGEAPPPLPPVSTPKPSRAPATQPRNLINPVFERHLEEALEALKVPAGPADSQPKTKAGVR